MTKPLVLVVGASGYTGRAISKALIRDGSFRVAALVRPSSLDNPIVQDLKDAGAELRTGDLGDDIEKLESYLLGVDVLITTAHLSVDPKRLFQAAKNAGVKRVVPSEFAPTAPPGVMLLCDTKYGIRSYIKELGLSYTFIEAGWWLTSIFPNLHSTPNTLLTPKYHAGDRKQKLLFSTFDSIGSFVAKIIADPRTLNQSVVVHDGETSIEEVWPLSEKISGEDFSDYPRIPDSVIEAATVQSDNFAKKVTAQYLQSLYIRGDNTLANVKSRGALDARELYPEVSQPSLEEEAKKFYAKPLILRYDLGPQVLDVFTP